MYNAIPVAFAINELGIKAATTLKIVKFEIFFNIINESNGKSPCSWLNLNFLIRSIEYLNTVKKTV